MTAKFYVAPLGISLLALSGCYDISDLDVAAEAPSREGYYRPSVESIVQRLKCELAPLADKTRDINLMQGDWVAVAQLTLDVVDDGSLAPTFGYTNGLFSFGGGAKLDISREQNVVVDLSFSMKLIANEIEIERRGIERGHIGAVGTPRFACPGVDTNLSGQLGLTSTADMAYRAEFLNRNVAATANTGIFGGYVQFIVTKNLNAVGPTWTLKHFKGPGGFGGISQVNTDKVVFAFAQVQPADKGASKAIESAKVYINNLNINELTVNFSGVRQNTQ
jgi:hypothetical protein